MTTFLVFIFLVTLGYLMGSLCSAVIVCRTFALPDPREEGSKNPGATNVLRIAGKQYAALVLLFDVLKGTMPVIIAHLLGATPWLAAFTALAAVIGHMYPVFFDFKGGKGVATAIGALLGFQFMVGVMVVGTWLVIAKLFRYSSLASIVAITLSPFYALIVTSNLDVFPPLLLMVILVVFKHRNNITRLIDGVEPKLMFKRSVIDEVMKPADAANEDMVDFEPKIIKKPVTKKQPAKSSNELAKKPATKNKKTEIEKPKKTVVKKPMAAKKPQPEKK